MLNRLLESKATKARNDGFTVASASVHGLLIVIAAYATAAATSAPDDPEKPTTIIWTKPAVTHPEVTATRPPARPTPTTSGSPLKQVSFSIDVPVSLPPVTATLGNVNADFPDRPTGSAGTSTDTSGVSRPVDGRRAYMSNEVEFPVSALPGGARPEYPAGLRSSGMEGKVVAQFVVDESGHALTQSVSILSATNDLFAQSVKRALPRMRFSAARIGSRAVPQLVQQLFAFRLDR